MIVLACGSRGWTDRRAVASYLGQYAPGVLVHGDCRGADQMAASVARGLGWTIESHPAQWDRHGKAAGPIRNQAMLDRGVDRVVAFHDGTSRGTLDMIARARRAGVVVDVVL